MDPKLVEHTIDLVNMPPLTERQRTELAALSNRPDSEIDTGDIAPLTEAFWQGAVRGRFYRRSGSTRTFWPG
jgi:hypothetical protein